MHCIPEQQSSLNTCKIDNGSLTCISELVKVKKMCVPLLISVHEHTAWLIMHSPYLILVKQWLCLFACSIKHFCNDTRQESLLLAEEYIIGYA